jgi:hypothetical protein
MSVIANYVRLAPASLEELRCDPTWEESLYEQKVNGAELIDIDKACDGLVWLLSRVPPPPPPVSEGTGFVMVQSLGGRLQGEGGAKEPRLEAGYGPASSFSVDQVAELSSWLQGVSPERLRTLYDPKRMSEEAVYPEIWADEGESALTEYLLPCFQALEEFFARAAEARQQVLVFFN